eukprot:gene4732-8315_t
MKRRTLIFLLFLFLGMHVFASYPNFSSTMGVTEDKTEFKFTIISKTNFGFQYIKFHQDKNSTRYLSFHIFQQEDKILAISSENQRKTSDLILVQPKQTWSYDLTKFEATLNLTTLKPYIIEKKVFITAGVNENTQPIFNTTFNLPPIEDSETIHFDLNKTYSGNQIIQEFIHNVEFYHPAFFIPKVLFYLIIIILCFIFRNHQPLKSRGALPIVASLFFFIYYISQTYRFFVPLRWYEYMQPTIYAYLTSEVLFCLISSIPLIVTNPFFIVFFLAFQYTFYICALSLGLVFNVFTPIYVISLLYAFNTGNLIFVFLGFIFEIYGFFSRCLYDKKDGKYHCNPVRIAKQIWKEDVLLFRFQYYVGIFDLQILLICAFSLYYFFYETLWVHFFVLYLVEAIFFFQLIGMILSITIMKYFMNLMKNQKDENLNEMKIIMKNEELLQIFCEFAKNEFSVENVECYLDILKYQKLEKFEDRKKLSKEMFKSYFNGFQSKFEVNIDGKNLKELTKKIKNEQYDDSLFDPIESKVLENLTDTYSRMILSFDYINFQQKRELLGSAYLEL